jgi:hypothetical protein
MQNNRRTFQIFDLEIGVRKQGAVTPSLLELIPVWSGMTAPPKVYPVQAGDRNMIIGDLSQRQQQNLLVLLLRLSDKLAPNSVYSDYGAAHFEEHVKVGNVGADFGCHVLISTTQEANRPNIYTCAIEKVNTLTYSLVQRLLSKFLNYEYDGNANFYSYPHPGGGLHNDGTPRRDRCCPNVDIRPRPSQTFINDLNQGRLTGVTLMRDEPIQPIGGAPYLRKSVTELKLTVDHGNMPANVWASISNALKGQSQIFPRARLAFARPGATGAVKIEVDTANSTLIGDAYIEAFEIGPIFPPLAHSAQQIIPRLLDPAIVQFQNYRS